MPRPTTIKIKLPSKVHTDDDWVRFDAQNQRLVYSKVQWVHENLDGAWTACGGMERSKPWAAANTPGRPMQVEVGIFHPASLTMESETTRSGRTNFGWSDEVIAQSEDDLAMPLLSKAAAALAAAAVPEPPPTPAPPPAPATVEVVPTRARPRTRIDARRAAEAAEAAMGDAT